MSDVIPAKRPGGVVLILLATVVAGGSAYLLMPIVAANLGPEGYAAFAVFWAALYLIISALSGVQQEISRATRPRSATQQKRPGPVARNFGLVMAAMVLTVTIVSAPLWIGAVFPTQGWSLVWPLAVGVSAYVIVAVLSGVLYGLRVWPFIAAMIGVDGVLRLALVWAVLPFTDDLDVIAYAVVAPFVLAPLVIWPVLRRHVVNKSELDVSFRPLAWNVSRTVVGSTSTGVLVSGFPLFLGATSGNDSASAIGTLVLAITLTRAPIIVAVMSLQSYLVIHFRAQNIKVWQALLRVLALIGAATVALSALTYWLGSPALVLFVGPEYRLDGGVLALLVASAGLVGALCATGPAALARSLHTVFTAGWVVAAAATVLLLLVPGQLETRAIVALAVGPTLGLLVHVGGLWRSLSGERGRQTASA